MEKNVITSQKKLFLIVAIMLGWTFIMSSCNSGGHKLYKDTESDSLQLVIENRKLNLGEINKSEIPVAPFSFDLKNGDSSAIIIDKVDVSCSCVKIKSYPHQLNPSQSGVILGEIDLKNQSGHIRKTIFVNYSDTCLTTIKIIADIVM